MIPAYTYFTVQSIHHSTIKQPNLRPRRQSRPRRWTLPRWQDFPCNRTFRATGLSAQCPQGFGSLSGSGKPPTRPSLVFPVLWLTTRPLSYPERAGIPNYKEGANTPSYNRPETSASPTWASAAVTGTFHALPSVDLTICRTIPDSANLPPELYSSAICSSGQTHLSPKYPLRTTRTSSYPISTHSNAAEMHNKHFILEYISQLHKSPEYTRISEHYNKAALSHQSKYVFTLKEYTWNCLTPLATARGHHP